MDLIQLMKDRYSCRRFSDLPVEEEKITAILEAGRLAPTACNNQPQKVFVLRSREALARWQKCTNCRFNEQLVLIVCYDKDLCWKREYDGQDSGLVDGSIVTAQMMLEAEALGVRSTWIMHFIPEAVRAELALPEALIPVSALAMGYPADMAAPSPRHGERKPLSETVTYL